jgi:predicted O-methyltransferase YrrM
MWWYGSHVFLNDFIRENRCKRIMEVGVYNGQNALNMVKTATKIHPPEEVEYYGFDFFHNYSQKKIGKKLDELGCRYKLFEGNTMETIPKAVKTLPKMDIIFIDGGKSYREAWSDWTGSSRLMHLRTGVFVHNVNFSGVDRMVSNIPRDKYVVEVWNAPSEGRVAQIKKRTH